MTNLHSTTTNYSLKTIEKGDVVLFLPDRTKDQNEFIGLLSRPVVILKSFTSKFLLVMPLLSRQPKASLYLPVVFDGSAFYASYQHLRVVHTTKLLGVKPCGKLSDHTLSSLHHKLISQLT